MSDTVIRKIAQGTYGVVEEVEWQGKRFARKTAKVKGYCPSLIRELFFSYTVQHEGLTKLLHYAVDKNSLVLYYELADQNLYNYSGKSRPLSTIKQIVFRILCALQTLHEKGLVHGDLTPGNILMFGDVPKLADFGVVRSQYIQGIITTPSPYVAPETLLVGYHSTASDIWSLGVFLYEWLATDGLWKRPEGAELLRAQTARFPLPEDPEWRKLLEPYHSPDQQPDCPDVMAFYKEMKEQEKGYWRMLVNSCLHLDPAQRGTVTELLALPLFSSFTQPIPMKSLPSMPVYPDTCEHFSSAVESRLFWHFIAQLVSPDIRTACYLVNCVMFHQQKGLENVAPLLQLLSRPSPGIFPMF